MMKALIFLPLLLIMTAAVAAAQPYLGVGHEWSDDPPGVRLTRIVPRSPAMIGGLEPGDIIIAIDDDTLASAADLGQVLSERRAGQRVTLLVWQCNNTVRLPLILGDRADYTSIMRGSERILFPDSTSIPYPDLQTGPVDLLVEQTIFEFKLQPAYERLRRAFRLEMADYRGFHTLDATAAVLLEPRLVSAVGERLLTASGCRESGNTVRLTNGMFSCLDVSQSSSTLSRVTTLTALIELLQQANDQINTAFAGLTAAETAALANLCDPMLESFITTFYLHYEEDLELVESFEALINSTHRVDFGALARAAELLASLDDAAGLEILEQNLRRSYGSRRRSEGILLDSLITLNGSDGELLQAHLLIADDSDNIHTVTTALLLDLGGNDLYLNNAGGTPFTVANGDRHHFRQGRAAVLIDFAGDDRYLGNGTGAGGSGLAGAGLLLDLSGNDIYSGARLTQGSAFAGSGLLHDYRGNDLYLGQEAVQGAAFFGSGLLRDDSGDDIYNAALYAQGCGGARGCGLLLDVEGNDRYQASHKHPNGYGNEATWSGWSQGVGVGFRQLAAGGIGLLCDRDGRDQYLAGNFSQGCGYFFGFGLFYDGGGDDQVTGNRYCQAALAHQAASWFCNVGGNDCYFGQEATNQAGSWDIGAAVFLDTEGDDSYQGGSLSQGGCAQNALAIFIDLEGRDSYRAGGSSQGAGGGNSYSDGRGARSLGLFFDLGGAVDSYADSTRGNDSGFLIPGGDDPTSGEGVFQDR